MTVCHASPILRPANFFFVNPIAQMKVVLEARSRVPEQVCLSIVCGGIGFHSYYLFSPHFNISIFFLNLSRLTSEVTTRIYCTVKST